ncbi:unnamed protein product, partial [Callosobruchus maculatus]
SDSDTETSDSDATSSSSQPSSDAEESKKDTNIADISEELAVRWSSYLSQGVDKETWKKLLESSPIPGNCTMLQGPMLNCEVQAMLSPVELKKDSFLHDLQGNLGKGIGILGTIITDMMAKNPTFHFKKLEGRYNQETVEDDLVKQARGGETSSDQRVSLEKRHQGLQEREQNTESPLEETTPAMAANYPGCSSFVRQIYTRKGITGDTIDVLLASLSPSTWKQYNCTFSKWWSFCSGNREHIFSPDTSQVLAFLEKEFKRGANYNTLNTHRSALNFICDVGKCELVERFMKGVFKIKPTFPRYDEIWDPLPVLTFAENLSPLQKLTLKNLHSNWLYC